jgi:hypothetical protein
MYGGGLGSGGGGLGDDGGAGGEFVMFLHAATLMQSFHS